MDIKCIQAIEKQKKRLHVAAYARVSTDHEEQAASLDTQIRYYTSYISANPDYQFVDVYYDFGISGFKEKRPGFQKMMADARAGKIDLIITKSITRFARNTDTVLKATRELKELGVGVFFELQNINTLSAEGELLMTVYAAFGQAESDSMRENARLAFKREMEEGKPRQALDKRFGYRLAGDGGYIPDQNAKWVVKIYELASEGYTCRQISRYLEENGIKTDRGANFLSSSIGRMIRSVVYKGDFIMQEHYTNDERKIVKNKGELPKVYIKDDHPRIVSDELWDKANEMLNKRLSEISADEPYLELTDDNYPYRNKLYCAECGYKLRRRKSGGEKDGYQGKLIWGCGGVKEYGIGFCKGVNITDKEIRSWGTIKEKIYISEDTDKLGKVSHSYVDEETWMNNHTRKLPQKMPALSLENYPFLGKVYCKKCGMPLSRRHSSRDKYRWVCLGKLKFGKNFCEGVSIPDEILQRVGEPKENVFIGKEIINGEERYGYTSKPDQIKERPSRRKK